MISQYSEQVFWTKIFCLFLTLSQVPDSDSKPILKTPSDIWIHVTPPTSNMMQYLLPIVLGP